MADVPLGWNPGGNDVVEKAFHVAAAITGTALQIIREQMHDLQEMFPFERPVEVMGHEDSSLGWFAVRMKWNQGRQIPTGGRLAGNDLAKLEAALLPFQVRQVAELARLLGNEWYNAETFTYVGPTDGTNLSWQNIQQHLLDWLNGHVVPSVLDRNRRRVLRAIPQPPEYNVQRIERALWVLECERDSIQGTAFELEGVGLITCDHVIGKATHAFRHDNPSERHAINLLKHNPDIDLAILAPHTSMQFALHRGSADSLQHMDHVLVAGHPNHRHGDSPMVIPGLIVGFRPRSGVRRLLTNAAIVAGCSGGPVFDRTGRVIGVAATGAELFAAAHQTEDHSIIPIDALAYLT